MASCNANLPEKGGPLTLPVNGPCTWILGFRVFTLVVVPGTADSVATTFPLCPERPESGSCAAVLVEQEELPAEPIWAAAAPASASKVRIRRKMSLLFQTRNRDGILIRI